MDFLCFLLFRDGIQSFVFLKSLIDWSMENSLEVNKGGSREICLRGYYNCLPKDDDGLKQIIAQEQERMD